MIDSESGSARLPKVLLNVQALRAVAAMLVVFNHLGLHGIGVEAHYFPERSPIFGPFAIFGLFGVDIFFVISGFIIFTTTANQFAKWGSSLDFIYRRVVRIYPPYWLVLIPMTLVFLFAPERLTQFHQVHYDFLASLLLLPQTSHPLVAVSWTLVFEMYFYVIFAFLLLSSRRYVVPTMAVWFCVEILLWAVFKDSKNAYLAFLGNPMPIEFILGVGVGVLYVNRWFAAPRVMLGVAIAACLTLWAFSFRLGDMPGIERVFVWGIPAALLVYGAVGVEVSHRIASPGWAVSIGNASYALYLWHLPVMIAIAQVVTHFHVHALAFHLFALAIMLVSVVAFSLAVYRYVERPMTRYLNGFVPVKRAAPQLAATAAPE